MLDSRCETTDIMDRKRFEARGGGNKEEGGEGAGEAEDRRRTTEDRGRMTEDRSQEAEDYFFSHEKAERHEGLVVSE